MKHNKPLKYFLRSLLIFASTLAVAVFACLGLIFVLAKGPSPTAKRLFVLSVKETSAVGFLADIFLDADEVAEILATRDAVSIDEQSQGLRTDTSLVKVAKSEETDGVKPYIETGKADEQNAPTVSEELHDETEAVIAETPTETTQTETSAITPTENKKDGIEIVDIKSDYYNGVLLIVDDPSRIMLGTPDTFGESSAGLPLREMLKKFNAIAGINGGGFFDPNGSGTGGIPTGMVIRDGEISWGDKNTVYSIIGFTYDGVLVVGAMTPSQAVETGVKFACSFGPALIVNGETRTELGGGLNPRTAIGQRSDGAVLLLAINGRQLGSLGATYDDVAALLASYGAVNASNLDGGASTLMMYDGEPLNNSAYVYGERVLATAFLVAAGDD